MANTTQIDPRNRFAPRWLPLLAGSGAFILFLLTINRWITLFNLDAVAKVAGWTWQPECFSPLVYLVTYPFRWVPVSVLPLSLNILSALCGAVTVGLLARSVAILPHDRTESERQAEKSDFSFMTNRMNWLPPLLAAAVCVLHEGFWQNSTNFTAEMVQVLVFAFIIWEILEFRLDERNQRLYWAALAFGAGMADSWAMIGFFPFFALALVWSKGVSFFQPGFLMRVLLCGLAGLSLYLLLPLLNVLFHNDPAQSFWQYLRPNLRMDWHAVKLIAIPDARYSLGIISLTSILPVFLMAIRWPESFGDNSRLGMALSNFLFHLINAIVLGVCLWIMFDPPFSPRNLSLLGTPGLMFYYLTALSIGYYSGYLLLVFGRWMGRKIDPNTPRHLRPRHGNLEKFLVQKVGVLVTVAVSALAIAGLAYKNTPGILSLNNNLLDQYGRLMLKSLPAKSGVLLCDSDNQSAEMPWRLYILQAELARNGLSKDFVPIDTRSLYWPSYHRFLHRNYPARFPLVMADKNEVAISPVAQVNLLAQLIKTNNLFYLNPSFGFFFEQFYQEPHGLVFQLKTLPEATQLPPLPDKKLIAENEAFWTETENPLFGQIRHDLPTTDQNQKKKLLDAWLDKLRITPSSNPNAALAGGACSQLLNTWGVLLQRSGEPARAARHFDDALKLNPDNIAAGVNREYNQTLQTGTNYAPAFSEITADQFGKYRSWNEVLLLNGPFDEPNYAMNIAVMLMQANYYREALAELVRINEQAPGDVTARLLLGQVYVILQQPERALATLHEPLANPGKFGLNGENSETLNFTAAAAYLQGTNYARGIELMKREVNRHPQDQHLLEVAVKGCLSHNHLAEGLDFINLQLERTPNNPVWLFGRGYTLVQMQSYPQAAAAFSQVLAVQTNNYDALFNRAIAYLNAKQFDPARNDYLRLQQTFTNAYTVAFGLSEIARQTHDTNEMIRNYQIYLANAPTNSAEFVSVRQRLAGLRGH